MNFVKYCALIRTDELIVFVESHNCILSIGDFVEGS